MDKNHVMLNIHTHSDKMILRQENETRNKLHNMIFNILMLEFSKNLLLNYNLGLFKMKVNKFLSLHKISILTRLFSINSET